MCLNNFQEAAPLPFTHKIGDAGHEYWSNCVFRLIHIKDRAHRLATRGFFSLEGISLGARPVEDLLCVRLLFPALGERDESVGQFKIACAND